MEPFPWWSEEHKKLAEDVEKFVEENGYIAAETMWLRKVPWELVKKVGEKRWFGVSVPKEYGGLGLGVTGACIVAEGLAKLGNIGLIYDTTMFGGVHQILEFGSEEQKRRWLPRIAKGEILGAITITEPYVGSDVFSIETRAKLVGNEYIVNGKKRFISNAGIASIYLAYARTSDKPEDIAAYKHLTALVIEKGTPGFTIEKINELCGWDGVYNGYLNFEDARVPVENRLGNEGDGWQVAVTGLNFERTLGAASALGGMADCLRYAVFHARRRVQFGQPTSDYQANQLKIADMMMKLKTARLLVYYTAYLIDSGQSPIIESTATKVLVSEIYKAISDDAIQVMGGDGWTRFYPVEAVFRSSKILEIGAGTNEVLRLLVYRLGLRLMADYLKPPRRVVHEKLGIPVPPPPGKPKISREQVNENSFLELLAENYRVNPGLYMAREDIKEEMDITDEQLDMIVTSLEEKGLVKVYRDRRGNIRLVRPTYDGLRKAKPSEYYRWYPDWVDKSELF